MIIFQEDSAIMFDFVNVEQTFYGNVLTFCSSTSCSWIDSL